VKKQVKITNFWRLSHPRIVVAPQRSEDGGLVNPTHTFQFNKGINDQRDDRSGLVDNDSGIYEQLCETNSDVEQYDPNDIIDNYLEGESEAQESEAPRAVGIFDDLLAEITAQIKQSDDEFGDLEPNLIDDEECNDGREFARTVSFGHTWPNSTKNEKVDEPPYGTNASHLTTSRNDSDTSEEDEVKRNYSEQGDAQFEIYDAEYPEVETEVPRTVEMLDDPLKTNDDDSGHTEQNDVHLINPPGGFDNDGELRRDIKGKIDDEEEIDEEEVKEEPTVQLKPIPRS
jgi:hypothetical protein